MKRIINVFLLALLLIIGVGISFNVYAATGDVYNIVTCPGEDMATQIQINWQSPTSVTGLKVQYTLASDVDFANAKTVDPTYRSFSRQNDDPVDSADYVGFSTARHVWNANLNDLTPSTKYIYRIVKGSSVLSDVYAFGTASTTDEEFTFLFMTDPQYYNEVGASKFNIMTEAQIVKNNVKFGFITGDISDKGGNSTYWDMFYTKSSLKKIPFATTVGNHEYYDADTTTTDNVIYNQFFYNPQNGPEHVKGSSYYFIYNNALFIMLDSEERNNLTEQQEWFRNVCHNTNCSYIVVGTHKSSYAGAQYYDDGKRFISMWGDIFDECQVDFVLSGHDHMYARTKSLYDGEVTTEKYKGTTYILGGSAGIKYYSKSNDENLEKWAKYFDRTTCCVAITLGKTQASVNTYDIDGNVLDSCKLDRKRFGTVAPTFDKAAFEKSFTVENAMPDMTSGEIKWSDAGYGYVQTITCTNLNSKKVLGTVSFINNISTSLKVKEEFWIGEVNEIKVDIKYKDGSTTTLNLELNNVIEWGSINSCQAKDITDSSFNLVLDVDFNADVQYITRIRVLENGKTIRKNFTVKESHLTLDELVIEMKNVLKPETKYSYEVQALNVNGTVVWTQNLELTSKRTITEEELYQNKMASVAFKTMIENLLKALGKAE